MSSMPDLGSLERPRSAGPEPLAASPQSYIPGVDSAGMDSAGMGHGGVGHAGVGPSGLGVRERTLSAPDASRLRPFAVVRGSAAILAYRGALERLAERCGQAGTMVHLPYLLAVCRLGAKVPHLLLRRDGLGELESAVLVNQYMIGGVGTGLYLPTDGSGQQSVVAPAAMRSALMEEAAAFLLRRGALVVLVSLGGGDFSGLESRRPGSFKWTTQTRTVVQTLALAGTVAATLGKLGAHTRRNLRHFQRRAVVELGARFEPVVELAETELLAMNRHILYPVPEEVAVCRTRLAKQLAGSFVMGLRGRDGGWLSLLGGRRFDGATTVDWQMNSDAFPAFSLGTAMRAFLIEDEVARGTQCLTFDGGTSHTMQRAFIQETVSDLLVTRTWLPLGLLRRVIPPRLPVGVLLSKMLLSKTLVWRRSGR